MLTGLLLVGLLMFFLGVSTGVRMVQSVDQVAAVPDPDGVPDPELETLIIEPIFNADPASSGNAVAVRSEGAVVAHGAGIEEPFAAELVASGHQSIAKAPVYDVSYYAGGDPPADRGSSVDLIVRAFRHAGVDLQRRIHEDIIESPEAYEVSIPDRNIDHRRIQNLVGFLSRHAFSLPVGEGGDWRPGDIVVWRIDKDDGSRRFHVGILSDRRAPDGDPLVIHHKPLGEGFSGRPSEDAALFRWQILDHFRWPAPSG